ncbi:hypothetical protein BU16DRAFT_542312 [Lophium mytilinum]|uniref:Uncharacterized protein n=1 Tax=Lophium mytilinum TaxID=390894 RepID=A0A6A6QJ31_9PEZI|nr:hypothetical protein BU16DRAFT_542312 [Lophium mytilinum]
MPLPSSLPTYPPSFYALVSFLLAFLFIIYHALPQLTAPRYSRGKHQPPPPPRPRPRPPPRPTPPPPDNSNRTQPHLPALHAVNLARPEDYTPVPIPTFLDGFLVNEAMHNTRHFRAIRARAREMRNENQRLRNQEQEHRQQIQAMQEQIQRYEEELEVMQCSTTAQTSDSGSSEMSQVGEFPRMNDARFDRFNAYHGRGGGEGPWPQFW